MDNITQETLDLMKAELGKPSNEILSKAGYNQPASATTGLQAYDLEAPAKSLYPVLSPLRNEIPRANDGFSTQANWKAVDAIDTTREFPGVSAGHRARAMTPHMVDYNAVYKGFGEEHYTVFEAQYAAKGYDDLRARAQMEALQAAMISEEYVILGGNTTTTGIALGQANTPTGTKMTGVGSMTAQAFVCYVIELTLPGLRATGLPNGGLAAAATVVLPKFTRTNQDGSTDSISTGHGQISAESGAITTETTNLGVDWVVVPKAGAVAWAWYTGLTGAGNCGLAAITTVPKFAQRADQLGTQKANAVDLNVDNSQDALVYDGILSQVMSGGYYLKAQAALAATGAGGVGAIDTFLQNRYDNYRLSSFTIWCNSRERLAISNLILGNGTANSAVRLTVPEGPGQVDVTANTVVSGYHNPVTGEVLPIKVHPYLPAGTILITHRGPLPYALANVPNVWQVKNRQEYYSIEWPLVSRRYEIGLYWDSVLQGFFPNANGVIQLAA